MDQPRAILDVRAHNVQYEVRERQVSSLQVSLSNLSHTTTTRSGNCSCARLALGHGCLRSNMDRIYLV